MGRAMRNVLLEAAIHIMPLPNVPCLDDLAEDDLFRESMRRGRVPPSRHKLGPHCRLHRMRDRSLAILLLEHLWEWYKEDERKDPNMSFIWEMQAMVAVLRLLPISKEAGFPAWPVEILIRESRERWARALRDEDDLRFAQLNRR